MKKLSICSLLLLASVGMAGCGTAAGPLAPAMMTAASSSIEAQHTYKIEDTLGIGPVYGAKLRAVGITTTAKLLAATKTRYARQQLAEKTGIPYKLVLGWADKANLMSIPGIGVREANFLSAAGVASVSELAQRNPQNLADRLGVANNLGDKFVGGTPSLATVTKWVAAAKQMSGSIDDT